MLPNPINNQASAIVLSNTVTGLATIRGIAEGGIKVHAALFKTNQAVYHSRRCTFIDLSGLEDNEPALIDWLIQYSRGLGHRPVVIPTSDAHALMLAKHRTLLEPYCRLFETPYSDLRNIIHKDGLYQTAESAGVKIIPSIFEPQVNEIEQWCQTHPGPYLLKPFYSGIKECALREKNFVLPDRQALQEYAARYGTRALIIQQLIQGGDGYVFDAYGLCNKEGHIVTMASHRRWRQDIPDFGATSYGEIPVNDPAIEATIFEQTTRLLSSMHYHGIFGIEWIYDQSTGQYYLIDFNARPFSSIGHLKSCGLNLPLLAYQDLTGGDLSSVEARPTLRHSFWVDILRDLYSFSDKKAQNKSRWSDWLKSVAACRDFAYWDSRDPGPGLYRLWQIFSLLFHAIWKRVRHQKEQPPSSINTTRLKHF
jgi:D-aspartate ligase